MTATKIVSIPLDKLVPGEKAKGGSINSRKAPAPVDGLALSIETHGLLVPLLIKPDGDKWAVMAGNRRLTALHMLKKKAKGKEFRYDLVPCIEHVEGVALEISLIENIDRAELHPVDEFEVYASLVEGGDTVEAIAKRRGSTIKKVRQALALGQLAPEVRETWRAGAISAETAEAFTITSDHKAQASVLKKIGKHGNSWQVRQLLIGQNHLKVSAMLALVGRTEYEKAGHFINDSLFTGSGHGDEVETVSDYAALARMLQDRFEAECTKLVDDGWKWATTIDKMPKDWQAWSRVQTSTGKYTKEQKTNAGCVVKLNYNDKLEIVLGVLKPGEKGVATPKTPKQAKEEKKVREKAKKEREQHKEETGGLTNALANRLSKQLTLTVRDAYADGLHNDDAVSFAIAALACRESPMKIQVGGTANYSGGEVYDDGRDDNEFAKYYRLARNKTHGERCQLLALWVSRTIDLTCHSGEALMGYLHPTKDHDKGTALIVGQIDDKVMAKAASKHFGMADYIASVSKELIWQAVDEALGKEQAAKVAKMKIGEARAFAAKAMAKTGWVPPAMRLK